MRLPPNYALQRTAVGASGHTTTIQLFTSQARRSLSFGVSIMRAILLFRLIAFAASLGLLVSANGALIVYDGFDYPSGASLAGRGHDGYSWGTNRWLKEFATSDWLVFSNSLVHPSIPSTGGHVAETNNSQGADYERKFMTRILGNGESVWFSFLVRVTQGATWNLYFTSSGLNESKFGVEASYMDYNIRARIGVGYNGSAEVAFLGQNVTRLIVGRYRYSASGMEQLDLWLDPNVASEPQPGGASSSNHIVHVRQLAVEPDRIDSVLLADRSLGSLAFDELRVGTMWADVISRAVDRVAINGIAVAGNEVTLGLSRLTPGATTTVERATQLLSAPVWVSAGSFVPLVHSTNWTEVQPAGGSHFYRVHTR